MHWLDRIPYLILVPLAAFMAVAPVRPEPHLVEKLRMLGEGTLVRPIDVFDLAWHALPMVLLAAKLLRGLRARRASPPPGSDAG